jgi:ABC-type Fe3+-siderophore transport system permease subunit
MVRIIYFTAFIGALINLILNIIIKNTDATLAWLVASLYNLDSFIGSFEDERE